MTDNPHIEKGKESSLSEKIRKEEISKQERSEEIEQAAIGKEAYVEAVGFNESLETTGKVAETMAKGKEKRGATIGMKKAKAGTYDPQVIREQLLRNIPSENVMRKKIENEIEKEIKYLHRKAIKMIRSPGGMSYFEMSNLAKKLRELKGVLFSLAKASLDTLKTLWLRFVHGVM